MLSADPSQPQGSISAQGTPRRERRQQPSKMSGIVPAAAIGMGIVMLIGIIIKGRGSKGLCTYDHANRRVSVQP